MSVEFTPEGWAETEFGSCDLGDARRTARAVAYAAAAAGSPAAATPAQTDDWSEKNCSTAGPCPAAKVRPCASGETGNRKSGVDWSSSSARPARRRATRT